jgi:hypothetical protein
MPRNNEPLSAAQIHSVYASTVVPRAGAGDATDVRYAKTTAYVREPAPSGRSLLRPDLPNRKKKY